MTTVISRGRAAEVLLVEDNDDDVELLRIALRRCSSPTSLHRVANGEECLAYLRREGRYADAPRPDLVLLDLNMPRMDGREVMAAIAADERLWQVPVVVLTTSGAEHDIGTAYRLRFHSYAVKPVDFQDFANLLEGITSYWFKVVAAPHGAG